MPRRAPDPIYWGDPPAEYNPSTPCPIPKHLNLGFCNNACVPLIVGPQQDRFDVHRERLFVASSWFKTTLEVGMQETALQQILLPADDPTIIEIFVQWLYTSEPRMSVFTSDTFIQLAKLYEVADRLFIHELKNYVVWKLFELRRQNLVPPISAVLYAFEHLRDARIVQKILVSWFTWHQESARTLTADMLSANPQFSNEMVLSMVSRQDGAQDILAATPQSHYEPASA